MLPYLSAARRFGVVLMACAGVVLAKAQTSTFQVPFEKFTLDNGLEVVFHVDRSDPVVAVALTAHVGSAREKEGRTGFAHLFEHLLFLESENLGKGGLDAMSARVGGSGANGSTSRDRTNYFQTVPKDALEKMIWAEADKLGYFINTVTEPVLAKEKQVVKNEKRQSVDNRPYGHTNYVIDRALFPADHPYNWQVIGSLEDLDAATLSDVKEFFRRWYVPNNVTLTVAGDFDSEQARAWVEQYFGEIPRGPAVEPLPKRPAQLSETVRLYHEDNFARLPQLTMAFPAAPQYAEDAYALSTLLTYLTDGKSAPLYQAVVEEAKVADEVSGYQYDSELAGTAYLRVTGFADTPLDDVRAAIETGLRRFAERGIPADDLARIQAKQETAFYNQLSSVLGKGFNLAQYNVFAGDPGFVEEDLRRTLAVTTEDVERVFRAYLLDRPHVATSFVPKGQTALALSDSERAEVVEEPIVEGAEAEVDASAQADYARTPSSFDRTIEPPFGKTFQTPTPDVWRDSLHNGVQLYGIESDEVPLVDFDLTMPGGRLVEAIDKAGTANLLARLMTKGTARRTPEQLEQAIEQLGASVSVYVTDDALHVTGNTLTRNYDSVIAIVTEILLEPRFDTAELSLARASVLSELEQRAANPRAIAEEQFARLLYGEDNLRAYSRLGTAATVPDIAMADLRTLYDRLLVPEGARLHVVGDIDAEAVRLSLKPLAQGWGQRVVPAERTSPGDASAPAPREWPLAQIPDSARVYFYDVPGAKQSVLAIGHPSAAVTDARHYPTVIANYILGGGGFASRLTQSLREGKGYTYGIFSEVDGGEREGLFRIGSSVRSNVTLESLQEIKRLLEEYPTTFSEDDLATTKSFLTKANARAFETAAAKLGFLREMSAYDFPADYVRRRERIVEGTTAQDVRETAAREIRPDRMIWLVVGDAATQAERVGELGYGEAVLLE